VVTIHADKARKSINACKKSNGKTQSDRVAEGEAILASIFGDVAVAA
jgi:hypothetical protein